jgi:hypothetical protein
MKTIKIYGLVNPKNNRVFYVGATSKDLSVRLKQHLLSLRIVNHKVGSKKDRQQLMNDLKLEGLVFKIKLLEEVLFKESSNAEKKWFDYYNSHRVPLMQNVTGDYKKQLYKPINK